MKCINSITYIANFSFVGAPEGEDTEGYNVQDFFPGLDIEQVWPSADAAEAELNSAYIGQDSRGIGVEWELIPFD